MNNSVPIAGLFLAAGTAYAPLAQGTPGIRPPLGRRWPRYTTKCKLAVPPAPSLPEHPAVHLLPCQLG